MRQRIIHTLAFILMAFASNGQGLKRNTIYFEAGGASFFYSINYDRLLFKKEVKNLAVRIGAMYLPLFDESQRSFAGLPIGISYLTKAKKNFIEIGLSAAFIKDAYYIRAYNDYGGAMEVDRRVKDWVHMESARFGIRHQPIDKKIFWNALIQFSVAIVMDQYNYSGPFEISYTPYLSFGIGYSF